MIDKNTLILIGLISLAVVASVYFLVFPTEYMIDQPSREAQDDTVQQEESTTTQNIEVPEVPTAPVAAVNCSDRQTEQGIQNCLDDNFQDCSSAFVTMDSSEDIETEFRITGNQESGFCGVKITLNKHPVESFSGESMTCMYDNSRSFEEEVVGSVIGANDLQTLQEGLESCEGSLAEIMKSFIEN